MIEKMPEDELTVELPIYICLACLLAVVLLLAVL